MLDQLYGKPSTSWRRSQVFLILLFWISRVARGNRDGPPLPFFRRLNRALSRFTPWQIVVSTLTAIYAIKNSDALLGLHAPEPLARLYSRNYYRATWIATALDAGFATAMTIRWKWLRDISSLAFSGYYLFFAHEADEKLRKYRAMCTVEMLRATWEKTSNPYIRFITRKDRPSVTIKRRILLPRPKGSSYTKPTVAWIYFVGTELELSQQTELIFDLPGGGFICMGPEHHEERTLRWTIRTGRPVIAFDYGKAPEYPYPFAIDEVFDAYKLLHETKGKCIGMSGKTLNVVITGDSAGANIAAAMMIKILETRPRLPAPVALVFAYAALSFHFTSWMPSSDLRVLRQESSSNIAGLLRGKEHLEHRSPLALVDDVERPRLRRSRTTSWGRSFSSRLSTSPARLFTAGMGFVDGTEEDGDDEEEGIEREPRREEDKSVSERVVFWDEKHAAKQAELQEEADQVGKKVLESVSKGPLETRLAMTSRTAFFNDRIISPPMCRAMALLYIGPRNAPDMHSDYHISPVFTPANLLAQFPPVYLSCGERDPFVDDTVIFAGKLREAKEARKLELLARETKFGEGLRMSGPAAARDPILDETEEDWVDTKILGGWSHGYLQMTALLPEAVHAIDMLADSISESFEKHEETAQRKTATPKATSVPSRFATPPLRSTKSTPAPQLPPSKPGFTSESDRDDENNVLSFTPKKRRPSANGSRGESPASGSYLGDSTSPPSIEFPRRPTSMSSSDEASTISTTTQSRSNPRTPDNRLSPPPVSTYAKGSPSEFPSLSTPSPAYLPTHIVAPHERALRDELPSAVPSRPSSSASAKRFFGDSAAASAANGTSGPTESMSDEEAFTRTNGAEALEPSAALLDPSSAAKKTGRSGSAGSLPAPLPATFVDAKDLLRRRREEAIYGISTSSSAVPSDDEESSGPEKVKGKK